MAVDIPLGHLDRPFDYAVTPEQDADAVPGARVRVRFSGRLRDGFVLERRCHSDSRGRLTPLAQGHLRRAGAHREVAALIRKVADHYAGTFADVMRLACRRDMRRPRRPSGRTPAPLPMSSSRAPWPTTRRDAGFLRRCRTAGRPRALWQVTPARRPSGDWALGLAAAAGPAPRANAAQ